MFAVGGRVGAQAAQAGRGPSHGPHGPQGAGVGAECQVHFAVTLSVSSDGQREVLEAVSRL